MADQNTIQCPHCGRQYPLTTEQRQAGAGKTVTCTQCQQQFVVPPLEQATTAQTPGEGVPMAGLAAGPMPGAVPQYFGAQYSPGQYGGPAYAMGPQNGMAVAGLVCSCIVCVPICSLLGIIFSIIGLVRANRPEMAGRGKGMAISGLVIGIIGLLVTPFLLFSILVPSFTRAHKLSDRVKCAANMRAIGQLLMIYANENGGKYPDDLPTLVQSENVSPGIFVCPSSKDTPAAGATLQTQAANLDAGGHDSYIYLGRGKKESMDPNSVLLYEPPSNHQSAGGNFLYADGHVDWIGAATAQQKIKELKAGQNPPP